MDLNKIRQIIIEDAFDIRQHNPDWWPELIKWLRARGWSAMFFSLEDMPRGPAHALDSPDLRGVPVLATVRRANHLHQVIFLDGKIWHDPAVLHLRAVTLEEITAIQVLLPCVTQ